MKKKMAAVCLSVCLAAVIGIFAFQNRTADAEKSVTVGNVFINFAQPSAQEAQLCFIRIGAAQQGASFCPSGDGGNRLGAGWILHSDGYYYHTKAVESGEVTKLVFGQFVLPATLTGAKKAQPLKVVVQAVAVQQTAERTVEEMAAQFAACGF